MNSKHIVVVGAGLAGCLVAIELVDAGHTVTLIEKESRPGGISVIAGGGIRVSNNAPDTVKYLKATTNGDIEESVLQKFAEEMTLIPERLQRLCEIDKDVSMVVLDHNDPSKPPQQYGFEGWQSCLQVRVKSNDQSVMDRYPHIVGQGDRQHGLVLFDMVWQNVQARKNITVRFNTALHSLVTHEQTVIGINTKNGKILSDAVVIASGGFENNIVMQKNYWQGKPVLNYGVTSNTGDGIKACQAVGAELSHMWHYHGGFGFKHPDGFGCEIKGVNAWSLSGSTPQAVKKLYHIIVDQNGRRFMNEHPPNVNDTGYRPFECFTPEETKYNRIPAYFISDSNGKASGPFGSIRTHRDHAKEKYVGWSHSNDKELELGIIKKFDSLDAVSTHIGCDVDVLTHTLDHYNNDVCKNGDNQFKRPSVSLLPITNPPYYVGEIYPMVGNTQGGPKKNQHFQVLDVFDHPINGLYTTGECGSIFNHLYLSSGNFAECFVGSAVITKHLTK